jgi:hypothetical protein
MGRVIALLAVVGASLLLAGCGGNGGGGGTPLSKAEYESQMQSIGDDLGAALDTSGASGSASAAAESVRKAQTALREGATKLEEITPPEDVSEEHAQLIDGVRTFADQLDEVLTKLDEGDLTALASLATLDGIQEIQTASNAITNKGYDISG